MSKAAVWTIIAIIVIVGIILLVSMGGNKTQTPSNTNNGNTQGSTTLPGTNAAQYNSLATSSNDFSALDGAASQLG